MRLPGEFQLPGVTTCHNQMMTPLWRSIPGCDGYEASTEGQIRSLDRYVRGCSRAGKEFKKLCRGKQLKYCFDSDGYAIVEIRGKTRKVHQLVALAFHGERPDGWHVNHSDENKLNNAPGNLEYLTPGDHNRVHPRVKLNWDKVTHIRKRLAEGASQYVIAEEFGTTQANISLIAKNITWKIGP